MNVCRSVILAGKLATGASNDEDQSRLRKLASKVENAIALV